MKNEKTKTKKEERKVHRVGGENEDWKKGVIGYIFNNVFLCDGAIVCYYCLCCAQC